MSRRSSKRRRVGTSATFNIKRALNKAIVVVSKGALTQGTQLGTKLMGASFPGTIIGLRWNILSRPTSAVNLVDMRWAIVLVKEGQQAGVISGTDATPFYTPEQNVLTWGGGYSGPNSNRIRDLGSTKTMRKMQNGDQLQFIVKNFTATTIDVGGEVQFFFKT